MSSSSIDIDPDDAPSDPSLSIAASKAKKKQMHWTEPFEEEILQSVLKPRIAGILREGVRNRSHLIQKFKEKYGSELPASRLMAFLSKIGFGALFGDKPLIRIEDPVPQAPPAPIQGTHDLYGQDLIGITSLPPEPPGVFRPTPPRNTALDGGIAAVTSADFANNPIPTVNIRG